MKSNCYHHHLHSRQRALQNLINQPGSGRASSCFERAQAHQKRVIFNLMYQKRLFSYFKPLLCPNRKAILKMVAHIQIYDHPLHSTSKHTLAHSTKSRTKAHKKHTSSTLEKGDRALRTDSFSFSFFVLSLQSAAFWRRWYTTLFCKKGKKALRQCSAKRRRKLSHATKSRYYARTLAIIA